MAKFQKGQSGNPAGRPKGSGDHSAQVRKHLDSKSKALIETAVDMALTGDTAALKLCIERICPALRPRDLPLSLELPEGGSLSARGEAVLQALALGELTPMDANAFLGALTAQAKLTEADELVRRVECLEAQLGERA